MKKVALFLFAAIMSFTLCFTTGCNNEKDGGSGNNDSTSAKQEQINSESNASNTDNDSSENAKSNNDSVASSDKSFSSNSNKNSSANNNKKSSESNNQNSNTASSKKSNAGGGTIVYPDPDPTPSYPTENVKSLYVSTTGSDANTGKSDSPLKTLNAAITKASAGTTIFMAAGNYPNSTQILLSKSGTASEPITIQAQNWGKVVIDFTEMKYSNNESWGWGLFLSGNYWSINGLEICHAGDCAIKVEGSHNYINRCVLHHNGDSGIQLGFKHETQNPTGEMCAYNTIENCDSYLNYDFDNWGDADGFACKMRNGKGNRFIGCRAWNNNDDAWDLYESDFAVEIINCWAWGTANGADFANDEYFSNPTYCAKKGVTPPTAGKTGNGNGIKCGGQDSSGVNRIINCIAFENDKGGSVKGFDENSHTGGCYLAQCTGWDNGYNFMFEKGSDTTIKNSVSFYTGRNRQKAKNTRVPGQVRTNQTVTGSTFRIGSKMLENIITVTEDDFISIAESDALAPRRSDGSLPSNGFGVLKTSSDAYMAGVTGYKYMTNAQALQVA